MAERHGANLGAKAGSGKVVVTDFVSGFEIIVDTPTGGDGRDTYAFLKKDTADSGTDTLDLRDFTKGKASTANEVRFLDAANSTTVQGKIGAAWVDVVTLKGIDVHDVSYDILS